MPNSKHEDAFLKMGVEYFREHILKLLGINYSYEEIGPTELVALTINELYMDFTFKTTEKDLYIHIEFQTTNNSEKKNLRRFHSHDALFSHNMDADEVIQRLKKKKAAGEALTEDDFAWLSLAPLMGGKLSRKDRIKEGILLAKEEHNSIADKVTAMLYTLADKFLDGEDLNEIKEAVIMTRLGQMIMDDGRKKGREEGRKSGEKQMAALYEKLESVSRGTEYLKACKDENYRKKLMEEFKIR